MNRSLVVALGLVLLSSTARAEGDEAPPRPEVRAPEWGRGPIEVADPFILAELRARWYARSPRVARHLRLETGARGVWESSYGWIDEAVAVDPATRRPVHRATIDAETRTLDLVARFGLFDRLELGVELRALSWRGGGHLDRLVRQFHRTFGIDSLNREQRPNDAYLVAGVDAAGRPFRVRSTGTSLGDSALAARVLAVEGNEYLPAVTLGLRLWLPTGSRAHADGLAETLTVDLSKRLLDLPIVFYAGAAYTYHDDVTAAGLELVRHRGAYHVGVEWEVFDALSIVAHFWQETPRERAIWHRSQLRYGNYNTYLAAGVKFEPVAGLTFELAFLENVLDPNTTGDVGFVFNVFWTWELGGAPKSS